MSLDLLKTTTKHLSKTAFDYQNDTSQIFRCFECKRTPIEDFKMLPCLHLCCSSCLSAIIEKSNIAMPQNGSSIRCSIFSCPECAYVIRIVNGDVSFLKDFVFSQESPRTFQKTSKKITEKMKNLRIKDAPKEKNLKESDSVEINFSSSSFEEESSKLCDFCCEEAVMAEDNDKLLYCLGCQTIVCQMCQSHHRDHACESLEVYVAKLKSNLTKLNGELIQMHDGVEQKLDTIQRTKLQLRKNKDNLIAEINHRTNQLFEKIEKHKDTLLKKLDSEYEVCAENQNKFEERLQRVAKSLEGCMAFSEHVLEDKQGTNLLNIYSEIETHITRTFLSCQHKHMIEQLRVDRVDVEKEDRMVEKLCGSMVTGSTTFGESQTIRKFNCGLAWPTCMTTNSETFVVAGRSETFETSSRLLFFSVKEHQLIRSDIIPDHAIIDLLPLPSSSNHFLLSTSNGSVIKYSFNGDVINTFNNVFLSPGGHMTHHTHNLFLISSHHFSIIVCKYSDVEVMSSIKLTLTLFTKTLTTHISSSPLTSNQSSPTSDQSPPTSDQSQTSPSPPTSNQSPSSSSPPTSNQSQSSSPPTTSDQSSSSPPTTSNPPQSSLLPPTTSKFPLIRGLTSNANHIYTILEDNTLQKFSTTGKHIRQINPLVFSSSHHSSSLSFKKSSSQHLWNPNNNATSSPSPTSKTPSTPSTATSASTLPFKCPSHITTDPFNNLIISDFTNDSVSLVDSDNGDHMGFLLSKLMVSCPHRLMLDTDNQLYVAQFGGDVSVHHYLSFVRRV